MKRIRSKEEKTYLYFGAFFQIVMIVTFGIIAVLYSENINWHLNIWTVIEGVGIFLFLSCLFMIYLKQGPSDPHLITSGLFRYTRHPMYTGLLLMNVRYWLPIMASHELRFYILESIFFICLFIAAWFQEKETVAKFGQEAEAYYAQTPRFFFMYPFLKK